MGVGGRGLEATLDLQRERKNGASVQSSKNPELRGYNKNTASVV